MCLSTVYFLTSRHADTSAAPNLLTAPVSASQPLAQGVFLTRCYVCIAMEWADGGDLGKLIARRGGKLSEDSARCGVVQQLLQA